MQLIANFLVGVAVLNAAVAVSAAEPVALGSRLELFVDHHLIDKLQGARLQLHHPRRAGVALKYDRPWEGGSSGYATVIHDEGKFRLYYRGLPSAPRAERSKVREVTCYAESNDGIIWKRPNLKLYEVNGTRNNNVILVDSGVTHNFAPFLDRRPSVSDDQRYKAVGGTRTSGLFAYASNDGIRWQRMRDKPIITRGAFDSQNNVMWSDTEKCYVCFFRTFRNGVRWISRTTSKNFLDWEPAVEMQFGDAPAEHLYTNQTAPYFRAPHIYIGTAARFWPNRWALTPGQEKAMRLEEMKGKGYREFHRAIADTVLLTSRGGNRYDRTFMESFVRPGNDPREWLDRGNYTARGVVPTGKTEMSIYVKRHAKQPTAYLERLTMRIDGFASVHAPYQGGTLLTKPLKFSGSKLIINFASSAAGGIRVEIQDAAGKPLPDFALEDCDEAIGNMIERAVTWRGSGDVGKLAGSGVRLRFVIRDADLYSFQFR